MQIMQISLKKRWAVSCELCRALPHQLQAGTAGTKGMLASMRQAETWQAFGWRGFSSQTSTDMQLHI